METAAQTSRAAVVVGVVIVYEAGVCL